MEKSYNSQNEFEKKNKARNLILFNFKISYKATVIKTVHCWHKDGYKHTWNRTTSRKRPTYAWSINY